MALATKVKQRLRIANLCDAGVISAVMAERIYAGEIRTRRLPKLKNIESMSHRKLLKVLRLCPESPLFNVDKRKLNM